VITTVAGTGIPGYSGDGGPAVNAELNGSEGIAVDGAGNLYIADTRNSLVRKVTVSTGIVTTVAGTVMTYFHGGQIGYGGDGGPATSALISGPVGVAVDGAGNLYIADTGNDVIREVTAADGIMHTLAGSAYTCAALGGDGGPALEAGLCSPTRVSLDHSGNLYASEEGANRIREVTVAALPPTTAASAPQFSLQGGTYAGTQTLTISDSTPMAEIYVTFDGSTPVTTGEGYHGPITVTANATIKAVAVAPGYAASPVTSMSYTITAPPPALISTVVGGQSNPTLIYPDGVAFDSSGNMYIADYYGLAVWKVAAGTGAISVAAGMQNQYCATQTGVLATSTCLEYPSHVAVDNSSNLYISNSGTNTVLMVSAKTGLLSIYAGGGTGYAASFGDGGSATSATLSSPEGLAFDNSGNLYIADGNHGLIRMVAASTGIITTVAGNTTGSVLGEGGPATSALLDFPIDVAVDKNGNLFIADLDHYRVRMVAAGTGVITTVAGDGLPGDQGDGGPGTSAEVTPEGLAVDAAGNLYVSSYPDRVRKISAGGGSIATIAGNGYLGYTGDGGAATMAEISNPTGLAVDASGNLYFAAAGSAVVRKVTFPPPMTMPTIAWAAPAPITYGTALSAAQLNATSSVAGTFAYGPALGTVLGAGAQTLSVTFTPADTNDYSIATAAVQLTVNQAMPAITWATSVAIPYGTPLTSAQLNASANVPGTFTYTPTAGTVLPPGNNTLSVVFTPADTTDYTSATDNVTIVVDQPVPSISSLSPPVASAGGAAFTLTIYGTGFIQSSVVMLGNNALSTSYQSGTQLTAQVPAADIANAGIGFITVQNPSPGGGTSNAFQFEIDSAGSGSPTFTTTTVTVTPGTTATYPVTLPSGAINVSVSCLNLPAGTACSYSAANGSVSITTSSTTPAGTYQITIVFTETLPGAAAAWLLPLFLLPIAIAARRRGVRQLWLTVCVVAILGVAASAIGCGGGGNGGSSVQQTHQATSSGAVTLTVQ
jgi:sugar lactone lactonase YvrE